MIRALRPLLPLACVLAWCVVACLVLRATAPTCPARGVMVYPEWGRPVCVLVNPDPLP